MKLFDANEAGLLFQPITSLGSLRTMSSSSFPALYEPLSVLVRIWGVDSVV